MPSEATYFDPVIEIFEVVNVGSFSVSGVDI